MTANAIIISLVSHPLLLLFLLLLLLPIDILSRQQQGEERQGTLEAVVPPVSHFFYKLISLHIFEAGRVNPTHSSSPWERRVTCLSCPHRNLLGMWWWGLLVVCALASCRGQSPSALFSVATKKSGNHPKTFRWSKLGFTERCQPFRGTLFFLSWCNSLCFAIAWVASSFPHFFPPLGIFPQQFAFQYLLRFLYFFCSQIWCYVASSPHPPPK